MRFATRSLLLRLRGVPSRYGYDRRTSHRSGRHLDSSLLMLRLVNDVRPIQDRCRQLELEDRDFDLHRLLRTWNMRLQIQQKHGDKVKLDFEVSKDVPQNVCGDSTACAQIVYNLISNACKFTRIHQAAYGL
jgi:signal transduction histidine kinase